MCTRVYEILRFTRFRLRYIYNIKAEEWSRLQYDRNAHILYIRTHNGSLVLCSGSPTFGHAQLSLCTRILFVFRRRTHVIILHVTSTMVYGYNQSVNRVRLNKVYTIPILLWICDTIIKYKENKNQRIKNCNPT